jgi:hypothetical protein
MEVNNFIVPEMGSAGIDISKRYGVGELFKGTPPDTTEINNAQNQAKAKTEEGQKAQQQENDPGNATATTTDSNTATENTISPRNNETASKGRSQDELLQEARELKARHARNVQLRQSDGFANEYQRNRATGKSNEYITGIKE